MWNSNNSKKKGGTRVKAEDLEKTEKHLSLSGYLNFLQSLFSISTSDSDSEQPNKVEDVKKKKKKKVKKKLEIIRQNKPSGGRGSGGQNQGQSPGAGAAPPPNNPSTTSSNGGSSSNPNSSSGGGCPPSSSAKISTASAGDESEDSLSDVLSMAATAGGMVGVLAPTPPIATSPSTNDEESEEDGEDQGIEEMNTRRRNVYIYISKKEVPRAQRTSQATHRDSLAMKRRLAGWCAKAIRQQALQSQKITKESVWRAKRLTREMQGYWKQAERNEKENRKRKEKEQEEQRKQGNEVFDVERQLKRLNFLVAHVELYSHLLKERLIMSPTPSLPRSSASPLVVVEDWANSILNHLECSDKLKVQHIVQASLDNDSTKGATFDLALDTLPSHPPPAPAFFGELKDYQTEGVNWMSKLYSKGLNAILADEVGGKATAIGFLGRVADLHGIWGPFLIIVPNSSLHTWQHEIKMVTTFKVVPYWGNPQERKILRQFWQQQNLHTPEASFHVVVTSYNIIVQDLKYFNKMKWQHLIVDEIQNKASINRWKALSRLNCRNRLLLPATPIQQNLQELWFLTQFLMPSLFESNEIELNEQDLVLGFEDPSIISRVSAALSPFMLRRTNNDVKNELCDKLEILVPCQLSNRQKFFHSALIRRVLMDDLLKVSSTSSSKSPDNLEGTRSLTGLLLQFRKVFNHPDMFEKRDMKSPFYMDSIPYELPKLIGKSLPLPQRKSNFTPKHIYYSIFPRGKVKIEDVNVSDVRSGWTFSRFIGMSPGEIGNIWDGSGNGVASTSLVETQKKNENAISFHLYSNLCYVLNLVFTSYTESFYEWTVTVPELEVEEEEESTETEKGYISLEARYVPKFLYDACSKATAAGISQKYFNHFRKLIQEKISVHFLSREKSYFTPNPLNGELFGFEKTNGWSGIVPPDKTKLITDSGKFIALEALLNQLKSNGNGNQVLLYTVMPLMLDKLEEFLRYKNFSFNRPDGSIKNHTEPQEAFVCLLCPKTAGITAIDTIINHTVIFLDSGWNAGKDGVTAEFVQRLESASKLKQITVYRLFCKGTVEERLLRREQDEQETLKPREFLSLLLDDADLERKYIHRYVEKSLQKTEKRAPTVSNGMENVQVSVQTDMSCTLPPPSTDIGAAAAGAVGAPGSGGSIENLSPSSPDESDDMECEKEMDFIPYDESLLELTHRSSYFDDYSRAIEWNWNNECISEEDEESSFSIKKPKIGRGTGKRGRPPSRVRVQMRDLNGGQLSVRRGPGRPRLKPIGPLNQGIRGRRPGRPPLSKKSETVSSSLSPNQRIFGIYPPDINSS